MSEGFYEIAEKAVACHSLTRQEIGVLLAGGGEKEQRTLFALADMVRAKFLGEEVHLRGLIEFSNHCVRNCRYCGLRRASRRLERYRMSPEEIVETAGVAASFGLRTVVLQSGEDPSYSADTLAEIVGKIKASYGLAIALRIGERSRDEYTVIKQAGADRFMLKHETANPALYERMKPDSKHHERVERLVWLRQLGYQVGAGNMVGLPGQTVEDIADDVLFMRDVGVGMAEIGPFIPHPATPLGNFPPGDPQLTLRTVAVCRLLLPEVHLPATTALQTLHPGARRTALLAGANVLMPSMTPRRYRAQYEVYPGKAGLELEEARQLVRAVGRVVGRGFGHAVVGRVGT